MLNLKFIQDNPELVVEKLKKKNFDASKIVTAIIDLYKQKNKLQSEADSAKAEMNKISKEIGEIFQRYCFGIIDFRITWWQNCNGDAGSLSLL